MGAVIRQALYLLCNGIADCMSSGMGIDVPLLFITVVEERFPNGALGTCVVHACMHSRMGDVRGWPGAGVDEREAVHRAVTSRV